MPRSKFKPPSLLAQLVGFVFVLAITAVALFGDYLLARALFGQIRSAYYPTAPGVVVTSEVASKPGDESVLYYPHVVFRYQVEGQEYTSDKIAPVEEANSHRPTAAKIVDRYPEGEAVTVYFSPRDHATAILEPGLAPQTLLLLALLLLAINMLAVLAWQLVPYLLVVWQRPGNIRIRSLAEIAEARVYRTRPLLALVGMWIFVPFVAFALAWFGMMYWEPWLVVLLAWSVVLVAGAWTFTRARADCHQLTIDPIARRLQSRDFAGEVITLPLTRVQGIGLKSELTSSGESEHEQYRVTLAYRDDAGERATLQLPAMTWEQDGQWLVDWLREQVHDSSRSLGRH